MYSASSRTDTMTGFSTFVNGRPRPVIIQDMQRRIDSSTIDQEKDDSIQVSTHVAYSTSSTLSHDPASTIYWYISYLELQLTHFPKLGNVRHSNRPSEEARCLRLVQLDDTGCFSTKLDRPNTQTVRMENCTLICSMMPVSCKVLVTGDMMSQWRNQVISNVGI
jgi:hypothetical protein